MTHPDPTVPAAPIAPLVSPATQVSQLGNMLDVVAAAVRGDVSFDQQLDILLARGCTVRGDQPAGEEPTGSGNGWAGIARQIPHWRPNFEHEAVRHADPLQLDPAMARLPELNSHGDTGAIADAVRGGLNSASSVGTASDAAAALRDIGMLLSSLRRHGLEPLQVVPQAQTWLTGWAGLTGTIPRDTVVHYGWWNPIGERERHFTADTTTERVLIDSVRRSSRLLPAISIALDTAGHAGLTTPAALAALAAAVDGLHAYAAIFETVRTDVSPTWFTQELRPFFDPYQVAGISYHGPAAAFVPLYLVDELLWGTGLDHQAMHLEALEYGRQLWRNRQSELADHRPLDLVFADRMESEPLTTELDQAGQLLSQATRTLLRFRGQHATVAKKAYAGDTNGYRTGSGGYEPSVLRSITTDNRDAATQLDNERRSADAHAHPAEATK